MGKWFSKWNFSIDSHKISIKWAFSLFIYSNFPIICRTVERQPSRDEKKITHIISFEPNRNYIILIYFDNNQSILSIFSEYFKINKKKIEIFLRNDIDIYAEIFKNFPLQLHHIANRICPHGGVSITLAIPHFIRSYITFFIRREILFRVRW